MAKIAFIGAGSTVFARNLLRDIFTFPELHGSEIALMDINTERLGVTEAVAQNVAARAGASPTITATTDRRRALDGADYAINMIQVGGYQPSTVIDFEIPKKYGLRQTIADTLGIGGIMRALRTIPVMLDMARDMEALCPDVTFLNYTNPMAMLLLGAHRARRRSRRSGSATACRARRRSWRTSSALPIDGDQLSLRRHQPHGLLSEIRAPRRATSTPTCAVPSRRAACPARTRPLRDAPRGSATS